MVSRIHTDPLYITLEHVMACGGSVRCTTTMNIYFLVRHIFRSKTQWKVTTCIQKEASPTD